MTNIAVGNGWHSPLPIQITLLLLMRCRHILSLGLILLFLPALAQKQKPNILIILADDMGYSDVGSFGGEIPTPHLDALAKGGHRYTRFYNSGRCCPSRAALLTGLHPHQAGMGHMVTSPKKPGSSPAYQGYLNHNIPTLAEVLRNHGWATLMSGKWHVGEARENWPLQRGFQRYFGLISGASSYYDVSPGRLMVNQNEPYTPPADFYATNAYADSARSFIRQAVQQKKPFLCYLAFTAPHWPLHAPEAVVARHRQKYLAGWDALREQRLARQKKLGLVPANTTLSPREGSPAWQDIKDQKAEAEKMAVYAAMVELMDAGIGRVVDELKRLKQYDNTVIIFLSDNGGCHEELGHRITAEAADTALAPRAVM